MPELPEVETVMQGMIPTLEGAKFTNVSVNRPNLRWPFPEKMSERITNQTAIKLRRRSKYILVDLSNHETLLIHLGMSGRVLISNDPLGMFIHSHPPIEKHDHVVFELDNGARITFNDPRRFGAMDLYSTENELQHPLLAKIGPEPLGNGFHQDYLVKRVKSKSSPIKTILLDQRVVAGLGNIYVCEALFRAGILPTKKGKDVSCDDLSKLVPIIREVLKQAIAAGGSSLRDFRQTTGELGYFQHSFDVYGREGQHCKRKECNGKIIRLVQSGRSSFYCGNCQR